MMRLYKLFYYVLNARRFRYLDIKALVRRSVRVTGKQFISIGGGTIIQRQGWIGAWHVLESHPVLDISTNCAIGDFCHISAIKSVVIEDSVLIANNVYISDNLHEYRDITTPIIRQPIILKGPVRVGQGSWIGENVCIMGANVGKNCVIGANSVVTTDIPDYSVAVGSPARVINYFDQETQKWVKPMQPIN